MSEEAEFVTRYPHFDRALYGYRLKPVCKFDQVHITYLMSVCVVDFFEIVDVDEDEDAPLIWGRCYRMLDLGTVLVTAYKTRKCILDQPVV